MKDTGYGSSECLVGYRTHKAHPIAQLQILEINLCHRYSQKAGSNIRNSEIIIDKMTIFHEFFAISLSLLVHDLMSLFKLAISFSFKVAVGGYDFSSLAFLPN
jgi:hypothetical protein